MRHSRRKLSAIDTNLLLPLHALRQPNGREHVLSPLALGLVASADRAASALSEVFADCGTRERFGRRA